MNERHDDREGMEVNEPAGGERETSIPASQPASQGEKPVQQAGGQPSGPQVPGGRPRRGRRRGGRRHRKKNHPPAAGAVSGQAVTQTALVPVSPPRTVEPAPAKTGHMPQAQVHDAAHAAIHPHDPAHPRRDRGRRSRRGRGERKPAGQPPASPSPSQPARESRAKEPAVREKPVKEASARGKLTVKKEIIVNSGPEETRVAIADSGLIMDLFFERRESEKIVGNIYKGVVKNILPGMAAAFVDIGLDKSAYLGVDDVRVPGNERAIEKMISVGQEILVQVYKEPINTKGAKATMDISLPGRLLVFMPQDTHVGVSRNIESREESQRLKMIINEARGKTPGGFIARTEAEEATEKELHRELKYLTRLWESIAARTASAKRASLIHRDLSIVFQTVRDYFTEDVDILMIDDKKEYEEVCGFVRVVSPELLDRVKHFGGTTPIFKAFKLEEEIRKLRSNTVRLPSGGYIIIQEAESLCAIDVNTGKFTGKRSQEETVTLTNLEAAHEVARQLRLRNIGGIIVIDFIDMKNAKNREKVLEKLRAAVKGDKAKTKIWPITKLGLIEMTRERRRESLLALMGETCPQCTGTGQVLSRETLFIHVRTEMEQMKVSRHSGCVRLRLAPEVAGYFKERLQRLKNALGRDIEIQASREVDWEDYQIIVE